MEYFKNDRKRRRPEGDSRVVVASTRDALSCFSGWCGRMKVAILTSGRFHVCDLARELSACGHDVAFYSLVPPWRTRRFGLPWKCNRWLGADLSLRMRWITSLPPGEQEPAQEWLTEALDRRAARVIERCDLFIGMAGLSTAAAEAVRQKYGAKVWIERGSRHIESQREILEGLPRPSGAPLPVSSFTVRRNLEEYERADIVVVPSRQAQRSFTERGFPDQRLFRNPYGVDLSMFPPTATPPQPWAILMAGTWSLRKGCDVLVEAWGELAGVELVHVGPVTDARLPNAQGFRHYDAVPQAELWRFYGRAHVFALASREEGLALVQAQALSSGLPIVCTDRTGGEDLRDFVRDPSLISVVPPDDPAAFRSALEFALSRYGSLAGPRDFLGADRSLLSWAAYGERYHRAILERV